MTEEEFLKKYDPERYRRPSLTTDVLVLSFWEGWIRVLLIERGNHPFKGMWASPGGFVEFGERLEDCAQRELLEETGVRAPFLRHLDVYSDVDRDPRPHIISSYYYTVLPWGRAQKMVGAGDDAAAVRWFNLYRLPKLACDHNKVCGDMRRRLRTDFHDVKFARKFLERGAGEGELLQLYKVVYGRNISRKEIDDLQKALL